MSGLLALLDDVAAIAKVAAASVDDIAAAAAKAGAKAAGVVIDDAAVTPKYVHGFSADRELPIIWRIALGSVKNKLVILLPGLMALNYLLPAAITPLLMLGGAYLCFEGAEKVFHLLFPHADPEVAEDFDTEWLGLTLGVKLVADVTEGGMAGADAPDSKLTRLAALGVPRPVSWS